MNSLTLHSKIVLSATFILIVGGASFILLFEFNNPLTIGNNNLFDKIQMSLFQSITTRTAGFASIPQENLTNSSVLVCLLLMFIGGSPVGTAGGIKTITFVSLLAIAIASIRNKKEVVVENDLYEYETYYSIYDSFLCFLYAQEQKCKCVF